MNETIDGKFGSDEEIWKEICNAAESFIEAGTCSALRLHFVVGAYLARNISDQGLKTVNDHIDSCGDCYQKILGSVSELHDKSDRNHIIRQYKELRDHS